MIEIVNLWYNFKIQSEFDYVVMELYFLKKIKWTIEVFKMNIRKANVGDFETVKRIVHTTIREIYPHYYPNGVVEFFMNYHSDNCIQKSIGRDIVLLISIDEEVVGTGSVHKNEISRVFVLPQFQGFGYGTLLMNSLENLIEKEYSKIVLDSSLSAYNLYIRCGYSPIKYEKIITPNNDVLCYYTMEKTIKNKLV